MRPALLSVLCLLLCCSLSASQRYALSISQVSIRAITSAGSCTDVFPAALNCSLPATLTVHVQWSPDIPPYVDLPRSLRFVVTGLAAEVTFLARAGNSSSALTGELKLGGYSTAMMGRMLTLQALDSISGNRSQAFQGLSLALVPPPVLLSIEGCQGSGAFTGNCRVDQDALVLRGTGLSFFNALLSYQLLLGDSVALVYGSSHELQALNDSVALLSLDSSLSDVSVEAHYTGVTLNISANLRWYNLLTGRYVDAHTNALSLSFAPLPPPLVTSASVSWFYRSVHTCVRDGWQLSSPFTNCIPARNTLQLSGAYLVNANTTLEWEGVGSWPCDCPPSHIPSHALICTLPLIPSDRGDHPWNVTVSTVAGKVTLNGLITFSTSPSIASLVPCSPSPLFGDVAVFCPPGSQLTIRGAHLLPDPLLTIQLVIAPDWWENQPSGGTNVTCAQSLFVDTSTLVCVLPALTGQAALDYYGLESTVLVTFPTYGLSSLNTIRGRVLAFPDSPRITSVTGCESSNGPLELLRCRGGDVLTVCGSHLNATRLSVTFGGSVRNWPFDDVGYGALTVLSPWSSAEVRLQLPFVDGGDSDVQEDYLYLVQWLQNPYGQAVALGDSFHLSFTWEPRPALEPTAASDGSRAAVLAAVLVPTLVVCVALAAWLVLRRGSLRAHWQRMGRGVDTDAEQMQGSFHSDNFRQGGVELK